MINSAKRKMKAEGKRIYVKALLITLISLMCSVRAWSQAGVIYPVDINVTLTPPYGTCLTDLTNSDRFRIQALMRDMSHPEYEMVIQMMVRDLSSLSPVFISTTNAFSLTAGQPTKVIGRDVSFASIADFFNYQNIRMGMQYVGSKCLPEGAYLFSFQAFDAKSYRTNRIPISREVTFSAFLEGGEVPILISPAQKDSIKCGVQSIHFTWMQPFVSSGVNTYRLQVLKSNTDFPLPAKDLLDNPNTNDRLEVTTMIPSYTYNNTSNFLEKNKTYYWRVVMCDADGNARLSYPNKGASEIRSFVYCGDTLEPDPDPFDGWKQEIPQAKTISEKLDTVKLLRATEDGPDVVRAFCGKDVQEIREKYSGIIVEVKKKSHDTWTPFSIESKSVEDTSVALGNLAYNELYQARAQYYINEGETTTYAPYSETIEFTISNPADTMECGTPLPELNSDCTGKELKELKEGDKFTANGVKVTILEVTSQSVEGEKLKISGTGYVDFPILRNFKLKVKFDNAVLNCNLQLEDGTVESVHDLSTAATIDLNNLTGKGAGGYDLPETNPSIVNMPNIDPNNPSTYESFEPGTLFSKDGEIYLRTEEGIIAVGKSIDLSTSGDYESNETRDDKVLVWFSNPDPANIAFDNDSMGYYRNIPSIQEQYVLFAKNYIIPWVANNPGRVVTLKAKPDAGYENSGYTDLKFVLKTSSTDYVELNNQLNGDGSYNVDIPGTDPSNITHIYVIARPSADKPYENVGRLKVACYKKKTQKVILVPVADINPDAKEVNTYLTSVYGKLGYSFEVEVDNDKSHVTGIKSDQINISSGVFTQYSDELKSIINTYTGRLGNSYDKSAAYLFLMKKASDDNASVGGIMPQKNQFGFIFLGGTSSVNNRTIAHELGHGLWGLDHTFDSYKIPDNSPHLMDYNNGVYLAHFEWSQIDKPVKSWALFNSDKDNEIWQELGKILVKTTADLATQTAVNTAIDFASHPNGNLSEIFNENLKQTLEPANILNTFIDECVDNVKDIKNVGDAVKEAINAYNNIISCQNEKDQGACLCKKLGARIIKVAIGEKFKEVLKRSAKATPNGKLAAEGKQAILLIVSKFGEKAHSITKEYLDKAVDNAADKIVDDILEKLTGYICEGVANLIKDAAPPVNNGPSYFLTHNTYFSDSEYDYIEFKVREIQRGYVGKEDYISECSIISSCINGNRIKQVVGQKPSKIENQDMKENELYYVSYESQDISAQDNEGSESYTSTNAPVSTDVQKQVVLDIRSYESIYRIKVRHYSNNECCSYFIQVKTNRNNTDIADNDCLANSTSSTTDNPSKPVYPKYHDDECNCKGLDDSVCDKNPFGQVKQTGPNKYENSSPRETNEGRIYDENHIHGIPKCSGWKLVKEENGCKTYNVSPRLVCSGKYVPNMFTVKICDGKDPVVMDNNVDLSHYKYDMLEYWDGSFEIIVSSSNNTSGRMELDHFFDKMTADDLILRAFVAMYSDWLYKCASGSATPATYKNSLNKVYSESGSFMNYYIHLSMNTKNDQIGINMTKKFIQDALDKLPDKLKDDVCRAINGKYTASELKNKIKKDCHVDCIFFDMMYDVANDLYNRSYENYKQSVSDLDHEARTDLNNYFAILGYILYYPKNDNYGGMGILDQVRRNLSINYNRSEKTSNILYNMFIYKSEEEVQERVAEIEARYKELLKNTNNKTALEQEKKEELKNAKDKNRIPNIFFDFFKDKKCK